MYIYMIYVNVYIYIYSIVYIQYIYIYTYIEQVLNILKPNKSVDDHPLLFLLSPHEWNHQLGFCHLPTGLGSSTPGSPLAVLSVLWGRAERIWGDHPPKKIQNISEHQRHGQRPACSCSLFSRQQDCSWKKQSLKFIQKMGYHGISRATWTPRNTKVFAS